ncbi:MAG: DUF4350 domain-containing protein [Candidatus Eisenbacteria bacterium]
MKPRTLAIVAVLTLGLIAAAVLFVNRPRTYDTRFDTRVANAAYRSDGPVVLFDLGHNNSHGPENAYRPFAEMLRHDGYRIATVKTTLSAEAIGSAAVLIVATPRGANETNDQPAFTDEETTAVMHWVEQGGALLLVTDHWPYGLAARLLAARFGVEMGGGMAEDPEQHDAERGPSHLVFSIDNGLLRDHAIVRGRDSAEAIHRVLTFTGQSISGPPGSVPFLQLSSTAIEYPPTKPTAEHSSGNVRVNMEYGTPHSAAGRAQAIALEQGAGRVVVLGEAGMLRAQRERGDRLVGMNVPGFDDRQLALNIVHWLSRAL